jgi:hypothetical protein
MFYEDGVNVDPTNIYVIHEWPTLTTLTKLWSFVGISKFYHILMLGFSHIAWALSQVTKGGGKENFILENS